MNQTEQALEITEKPRYVHYCACCKFLGTYRYGRETLDLYVHGGRHSTVLARYGSEDPEYTSGTDASYGNVTPLQEARLRAQKLGLLEYDVYQGLSYARPGTPAYAELLAALPFTVEYQAWLALSAGNVERSQGLATHLLNLARAKKYQTDRSIGACLLEIENRLVRILIALKKGGELHSFDEAEAVTEFLWPTNAE